MVKSILSLHLRIYPALKGSDIVVRIIICHSCGGIIKVNFQVLNQ